MNHKELKKTLARISLASLIAANGIVLIGCASSSESTKSMKEDAKTEQGKTSCTGETGKTSCSGNTSCNGGTSCGQ